MRWLASNPCNKPEYPMPATIHDIVDKLWNLCNVLKDDRVT
jgi:hypothetical protein